MNLATSKHIHDRVHELAKVLLNEGTPDGQELIKISAIEAENCIRMLKPASNRPDYSNAIRKRLREKILNDINTGSEGPVLLSRFDDAAERLKSINQRLLGPFLAFIAPVSFHEKIIPVFHNALQAERTLYNNVPLLDMNAKPAVLPDTMHQEMAKPAGPGSAPAPRDLFPPASEKIDLQSSAPVAVVQDFWLTVEVERALLLDLIYILQGVSGKHIKYDMRSESYLVDPSLQLPVPARDMVLCIAELGWLYNRVAAFLKGVFNSSPESKGLITQAFGAALQAELNDYYRLLAVIEQELTRSSPVPVPSMLTHLPAADPTFRSKHVPDDPPEGNYGLTLLRLKAWMAEPTERMCVLARLVDGAAGLTGGALVSRLHGHCRHGDLSSSSTVQRIMDSVCCPLYSYLTQWVLDGDLKDPHKEFFILLNPTPATNIWTETYTLKAASIPSFIPVLLAQKMLNIGKSINFIKLCASRLPSAHRTTATHTLAGTRKSFRMMNKSKRLTLYGVVVDDEAPVVEKDEDEEARAVQPDVTSQQLEAALNAMRHNQEQALSQHISVLGHNIDKQLLHLLRDDFHLYSHLLALKKFMLLGQGDFINCLIDNIGPELKKRSNVLFKHNLLSILDSSLRASNAQYEEEYILSNVNIRLLDANAGDTGWEVFSLDYNITIPMNSIVHTDAMRQYRIAFHMLWRLKRVEWSLANTWKNLNDLAHVLDREYNKLKYSSSAASPSSHQPLRNLYDLKRIFHRCNLNRAAMMHIVNNLSAFLMFEVLETAWVQLTADFEKARSLDDLIAAHDRYLSDILDKSLLSPAHEKLQLQIQNVLNLILRFCSLEEKLVDDTLNGLAYKRLADGMDSPKGKESSRALTVPTDFPSELPSFAIATSVNACSAHLVSRIDETVKEYSAQFDVLMTMLKDEGEKSGEILRYLTFRLDFNDYHKLQSAKGAGLGITSTPRNVDSRPGSGSRGFGSGGRFPSANDLRPTKLSLIEE